MKSGEPDPIHTHLTSQTVRGQLTEQTHSIGQRAVFDRILETLQRVVPCTSATIFLREQNMLRVAATWNHPDAERVQDTLFSGNDNLIQRTILETKRSLVLHDAQQDPRFEPWGDVSHVRGWMGVPLILNGSVIGVITVDGDRPGMYTETHAALVQAFADQAVIALENARLLVAERQRRREAETLRAATSALTIDVSVEQTLYTLLQRLGTIVAYDSSCIMLHEGDRLRAVAAVGLPDPDQVIGHTFPTDDTFFRRLQSERRPVWYHDVQTESSFWGWGGTTYVRGWMGVPLLHRKRMLGYITLDSRRPGAYGEKEAALAQAFANHVAIVIANAQLFQQTQQRAQELTALNELSAALRPLDTSQDVMRIGLQKCLEVFGATRGRISVPGAVPDALDVVMQVGWKTEHPIQRYGVTNSIVGRVFQSGEPYLSPNIFEEHQANPESLADWLAAGFKPSGQALFAPLRSPQHIIGVISLVATDLDRKYTQADLHLFATMADIIGNALDRTRVLETLEQRVLERTQALAQANERLQELDRLKSEFVANVSHELRTPLTNIKLYLDLLRHGRTERHEQYLDILQTETDRLYTLIETVLDLSRLDAARKQIHAEFSAFEFGDLVESVVETHRPRAETAQLTLTYVPSSTPLHMWGDRQRLAQVVSNLLINAINYTPAGGQIHIIVQGKAQNGEDGVTLIVEDTGVGIPKEEQPQIFHRFYRGRRVAESGVAGTGLGLAIVHEIVDMHQGNITLRSAPGEGSAFTIWLPLLPGNKQVSYDSSDQELRKAE